jgi:hypothetical protein
MKKLVDMVNDTIKCALLTSSHSPDKDSNTWSQISSNEVSGTGYSAGGATLADKAVTQNDTTDKAVFDATDVTWSSSTITARYAVLYDTTVSDNLICCIDFGANYSSTNGNFTIQFDSAGVLTLS